jgi:hypothetical protein
MTFIKHGEAAVRAKRKMAVQFQIADLDWKDKTAWPVSGTLAQLPQLGV